MPNFRDDSSFEMKQIEKWLTELYLDPLTSYLDETAFRIDIFETEEAYIIEAMLTDYTAEEISVYLKEEQVQIMALPSMGKTKKKKIRMINFPCKIIHKEVQASFSEGILEITLSKVNYGSGENRYVPIS